MSKGLFFASADRHFIVAGDVIISHIPCKISTVLGSCVSVTMLHRGKGLAAMCHGMLPAPTVWMEERDQERWRYLSHALSDMRAYFAGQGAEPACVEVKIFGGGWIINTGSVLGNVGEKNLRLARDFLDANGFRVEAEHVAGQGGRMITFDTSTGAVSVKAVSQLFQLRQNTSYKQ